MAWANLLSKVIKRWERGNVGGWVVAAAAGGGGHAPMGIPSLSGDPMMMSPPTAHHPPPRTAYPPFVLLTPPGRASSTNPLHLRFLYCVSIFIYFKYMYF